jgi:hypothetical protein
VSDDWLFALPPRSCPFGIEDQFKRISATSTTVSKPEQEFAFGVEPEGGHKRGGNLDTPSRRSLARLAS